jgi:hypothetical protein
MASTAMTIRKVSATNFRDRLNDCTRKTKGSAVTLVENRRQEARYFVDKEWFDAQIREHESIKATFEILADRHLTAQLLKLAETIDDDVRTGKIHLNTMDDMFGE